MANVFGTTTPTIYVGSTAKTLPAIARGGRTENFIKDPKTWIDLNGVIHERIKGYRLHARYVFGNLTSSTIDTILEIFNAKEQVYLQFSNLTHKKFPVIVQPDIQHDLWNGISEKDQVVLEFVGTKLENNFYYSDIAFAMPGIFNGFGIISQGTLP